MVLTLIEKKYPLDYVIFVDLGKEFKSIYDTWERLTQILEDNGIKYKRLELMHSFDYYFSDHEVKTKDGSYKSGFTYLEDNGVQLYQVLDRVSYYCCGNKNLKELKAIYKYLPEYWERLKQMQERTQKPFRQDKTIFDLEIRFKSE